MSKFKQCILKFNTPDAGDEQLRLELVQAFEAQGKLDIDPNRTLDAMVVQKSRAKREAARDAVVLKTIETDFRNYQTSRQTDKEVPFHTKLKALITKDAGNGAPYRNIEYTTGVYQKRFHTKLAGLFQRFQTKGLGFFQDEKSLNKLIRAIYGEATDDAQINQFAKDWLNLVEETRLLKNKFGASIPKNERFLLPQRHDADAILSLGGSKRNPNRIQDAKKAWKEMIKPLLDRRYMLDDAGLPLSDNQLNTVLDESFDSIVTGGLNKVEPFETSFPSIGKKLSRKGSERRILYFKDADSWIQYQNEFGRGDIMASLRDFIDGSAHDISLLEIMGTNPQRMFERLMVEARKQNTSSLDLSGIQSTWNVVSGNVNDGHPQAYQKVMQGLRNVISAAFLGGATLSAIADVGFQVITAKYNKMSTYRLLGRVLKNLKGSETDKQTAALIGLGCDCWIDSAHSASRYAEPYGLGITSKVASAVMRASFLEAWTHANRRAFGIEMSGTLAREFKTSWGSLDADFKQILERNAITESDWDQFRSTPVINHEGTILADFTKDESLKFNAMVLQETDIAVPQPDAKVRGIMTGGQAQSTLTGQIYRSAFAIKSFPITIATTHLTRGWVQASFADRASYLGTLFATTTLFGAIAIQAKDLAAGRDPRAMNRDGGMIPDPEFLTAAFLQGGGAGILGDFVFSDVNRFGQNIQSVILGPTFETFNRVIGIGQNIGKEAGSRIARAYTTGELSEIFSRGEYNLLGDAIDFVDTYTPSIWQTKLLEQALFSSLNQLADPDHDKKLKKLMRKREKEYNQGYWWARGEYLPQRLPDVSNAYD